MDYLKGVQNGMKSLWDYIVENKWATLFIIFGILIAYSIGQQMAVNRVEGFENRCEKEKRLYEDNRPCDSCDDEEPKKKEKKVIASASCPKMPDLNQYVLKKNVPDLKDYVHKTLLPDMSKYMLKEYVKDNYVPRSDCKVFADDDSCDDDEEIQVADTAVCPPKMEPKPDCNKDLEDQTKTEKKRVTKEQMKKYQEYLDKNKDNMDVTYTKLEDAFLGCNMKMCAINGLPNGLKPLAN